MSPSVADGQRGEEVVAVLAEPEVLRPLACISARNPIPRPAELGGGVEERY